MKIVWWRQLKRVISTVIYEGKDPFSVRRHASSWEQVILLFVGIGDVRVSVWESHASMLDKQWHNDRMHQTVFSKKITDTESRAALMSMLPVEATDLLVTINNRSAALMFLIRNQHRFCRWLALDILSPTDDRVFVSVFMRDARSMMYSSLVNSRYSLVLLSREISLFSDDYLSVDNFYWRMFFIHRRNREFRFDLFVTTSNECLPSRGNQSLLKPPENRTQGEKGEKKILRFFKLYIYLRFSLQSLPIIRHRGRGEDKQKE